MAAAHHVEPGAVAGNSGRPPLRGRERWDVGFCCLLFAALCGRKLLQQEWRLHSVSFVDDAYYYFVAARNLAAGHGSSFDGFTLTNGYHPLWMGMVALQYKMLGASLLVTRLMEYALGLGALVLMLAAVRLPNLLLKLMFTLGLFGVMSLVAFNGMETAAFALCVGVMCYASVVFGEAGPRPVWGAVAMGLATTALIAARIDAVVFAVPWLVVVVRGRRRRMIALTVVTLAGAVYAGVNWHMFGVMAPISGEVKSLGGLQWNHPLARQLARASWTSALFYAAGLAWVLALFLMLKIEVESAPGKALRGLQQAYVIGLPVYMLRLMCFSSWEVWAWYGYCLVLGYVACAPVVLERMAGRAGRVVSYRTMLVVVSTLIVLRLGWSYARIFDGAAPEPGAPYYAVNHEALERYGSLLGGARVAMGDRAGEFAYEYGGGVNQMEGIMNDKVYLDTLRKGGDVRGLLCAREVRYVVAYESDLGGYERYRVETIRSYLSQFPAPVVEVRREDEIGKVSDGAQFDGRGEAKDVYLYLWRLRCGSAPHPVR